MQAMLKRMGIATEQIDAVEVIIKKADGKILIIKNPDITKMNFQGNSIITMSGNIEEKESLQEERIERVEISDDDINLVVMQTGKSREEAKKALEEEEGDIAKAIMKLKGEI